MTHRIALRTTAITLAALSLTALPGCLIVVRDYGDDYSRLHWNHPHIGVELGTVGRATASQLQLNRDTSCVVTHVTAGGPADRAGLRTYDIITDVDGRESGSISSVRSAIRSKAAGETVKLTILREGKALDLDIPVED